MFEKNKRPGGLLRYGIPDFKLDKSLIDRRIAQMEAEGVRFNCGTSIGIKEHPDGVWSDAERVIDPQELLRDFSAVVLAIGSETPRDLKVAGRELKGVHFAMEYLPSQNKINADEAAHKEISAQDKKVLIICRSIWGRSLRKLTISLPSGPIGLMCIVSPLPRKKAESVLMRSAQRNLSPIRKAR